MKGRTLHYTQHPFQSTRGLRTHCAQMNLPLESLSFSTGKENIMKERLGIHLHLYFKCYCVIISKLDKACIWLIFTFSMNAWVFNLLLRILCTFYHRTWHASRSTSDPWSHMQNVCMCKMLPCRVNSYFVHSIMFINNSIHGQTHTTAMHSSFIVVHQTQQSRLMGACTFRPTKKSIFWKKNFSWFHRNLTHQEMKNQTRVAYFLFSFPWQKKKKTEFRNARFFFIYLKKA